jgi:hypothetical protein
MDDHAAEVALTGGADWRVIDLGAGDFKDATGAARSDWSEIKELRLAATDRLASRKDGKEQSLTLGDTWKGPRPKFRNFRWVPAGQK